MAKLWPKRRYWDLLFLFGEMTGSGFGGSVSAFQSGFSVFELCLRRLGTGLTLEEDEPTWH